MHPTALASMRRVVTAISARDPSGEMLRQFVGVSDSASLAALSDAQVYERFMRAVLGAQPGVLDMLRTAKASVIGHVDEEGGLTHVVYRLEMSPQGITFRKVDVLTLRRDGGEWRAMLTGDIENLVARLGARRT
jgi:hypothetical protein